MDQLHGDFNLMEFLKKPAVVETLVDVLLCVVPIWVAVMIGLVIGWSWKPRWTGLVLLGARSKFRFLWTVILGLGAHRLWLAFTALSVFSVASRIWSNFKGKEEDSTISDSPEGTPMQNEGSSTVDEAQQPEQDIVTEKDLQHLLYLVEGRDGDISWQSMMERSTPNMQYHAWRHDPETGPTILRSRTVFEDATPELVRDFFWDDEFRLKWDPMLSYFKILEECPQTGRMTVHWIKKFPFFCSDREYIIGRRIWESRKTFYCVTKGVKYSSLPKREKPRRVEDYFSSWIIRAVASRKGDGQLSACEVTFVHYEDMGIPKDVAKLGIRHGMWGTVKKLHSGMRAYQLARKPGVPLSRCALMARSTVKISIDSNHFLEKAASGEEVDDDGNMNLQQNRDHGLDWKWIALGGAVAVVCGIHSGAIGKALLFGAGRRLAQK